MALSQKLFPPNWELHPNEWEKIDYYIKYAPAERQVITA